MFFKLQKSLPARLVLILFLLGGMLDATLNTQVSAAPQYPSIDLQSTPKADGCYPDTGWMWTRGSLRPDVAQHAEMALQKEGIESVVTASDYGEKDSCGTFELLSIDFTVTLKSSSRRPLLPGAESGLAENVLATLSRFGEPQLGNVQIDFGSGIVKSYSGTLSTQASSAQTDSANGPSLNTDVLFHKKVLLLVYDPILSTGQDLDTYMGWTPYMALAQGVIDSFRSASHGQLQYTIVETRVVADEWPVKIDGFRYTEETYLPVVQNSAPPHNPDLMNYDAVIDDPRFDICGKLNRGEIDELWMYGGPWFGFYESTLVGPGAYWFNSPPLIGTHNCNKLLPIMGLSYERGVGDAMHSFGHRAEATMTKVYGSWQENRTAHNWDRFALVKAQSPAYSYSGCGSIHYPPNGMSGYDYGNPGTVLTNCEDFRNYPNLSDPLTVAGPVTCTAWNCGQLAYLSYWFSHLPSYAGCGPDRVANNWWSYFVEPSLALSPSLNCPPLPPESILPGDTVRVSVNSAGEQVPGYSFYPSISADGRYVAFQSTASDLVPGDTNEVYDVFVRDMQTGTTTRVSVDSSGAQGNGHSQNPSISADGRYIAFESDATNLVPGDTNLATDVFVHDMQTGLTTRASVDSSGGQAKGPSPAPVISADGQIVVFESGATNLVPEDTHEIINVFAHDMQNGMTRLVSVGPNGVPADAVSDLQSVSADGRYVAFYSYASNLVSGDTNEEADIFVKDLQSGATTRVSVASDGTQADGASEEAAISADGRYIAFDSNATNLVAGDTNGKADVFLHDIQTAMTTRISIDSSGVQGNDSSRNPFISADGRYIVFQSEATNLVSGDTNTATDIFVRALQTGTTRLVSIDSNGIQANGISSSPAISADGQSIVFQSDATNLAPGDTNQNTDVFLHRPETQSVPPSAGTFYLSLANNQTVGGVPSADEDILRFDGTHWSMFFDGSDVGVQTSDLVAFSIMDADTILMSFGSKVKVNGIVAMPQDILRFDATSLGSNTAGIFSLYFDGSDVGLSADGEKIDALATLPDGRLLISTIGSPSVSGLTGTRDEDVLAFTPTSLGDVTKGTWSLYFDGSDVGLSNNNGEDIDALDVVNENIYLSTRGSFSVSGLSGKDEDVFVCTATSLGDVTACRYSPSLYFDGSTWGLAGNDVDGFHVIRTTP